MARGDLSDDAPMANLEVTGANGIAQQPRVVAGITPTNENGSGGRTGLMAPPYVTVSLSRKVSNYLVQPIWLRLVRRGKNWIPYTSLDGVAWTQAGSPEVVDMLGAWVGIFASDQNSDFGNKGYIRAVFDHVSFTPTAFYQVGQSGVPPAAGPVPANWAGSSGQA
jgi:hypothetical protein